MKNRSCCKENLQGIIDTIHTHSITHIHNKESPNSFCHLEKFTIYGNIKIIVDKYRLSKTINEMGNVHN